MTAPTGHPERAPADVSPPVKAPDPNRLMRTCANCGSEMEERKCSSSAAAAATS